MNMLPKLAITLLILTTAMLSSCRMFERNFSLSAVSSFPKNAEELKERWYYCEKCLNDPMCKSDDIDQCKTITIPSRDEALSKAVGTANIEVVYFLIDVANTDVNGVTGIYQETPLEIAAYYGTKKHREIAEFLISHGANINSLSLSTPRTPLLTAIWKNNVEFAKLLLKHGADPTIKTGKSNVSPCIYALHRNRIEIIPLLPNCCSTVMNRPSIGTISEIKAECLKVQSPVQ